MGASATSTDLGAVRWDGSRLSVLDQTLLPEREVWIELRRAEDTAAAIARLAVRGAPNIGVVAAYALAMEAACCDDFAALAPAAACLRAARPTAANLGFAIDRVLAVTMAAPPDGRAEAARIEAEAIQQEEDAASRVLAELGADWLLRALAGRSRLRLLTHCNTGALAAGGQGSALAIALELARRTDVHVLTCETRPLLQGARLTAWELDRLGLSHELLVDGAAAGLVRRGEVDAVVVGCDRVAANGDVANKVGTYGHALAARAAGIPFVVAGPISTVDLDTPDGDRIPIEERDPEEVRTFAGAPTTLPGTRCRNPAFDVTPAELVSALVTERGIAAPPGRDGITALASALAR